MRYKIIHADTKKKSKYIGGFVKNAAGKAINTKAYNHDYYIHNKEKWKKLSDEIEGESVDVEEDEDEEKVLFVIPKKYVDDGYNFLKNMFKKGQSFFSKKTKAVKEFSFLVNEKPKSVDQKIKPHKYLYKITKEDGSTRYFYDEFEYYNFMNNCKIKDGESSIEDDCEAVNPHYNEGVEYQMNCPWATYAYDLRRRGYDVEAMPDADGQTIKDIVRMYENTSVNDFVKYRPSDSVSTTREATGELFSQMAENGDGARGHFTVQWTFGGGHDMAWEVVDGQTYIIDAQANKIYDEKTFANSLSDYIYWNDVFYIRTDDKKLSKYIILDNGETFDLSKNEPFVSKPMDSVSEQKFKEAEENRKEEWKKDVIVEPVDETEYYMTTQLQVINGVIKK